MSKNIVVCCDGTCNEFGETPTNVVRLFQLLSQGVPEQQVSYYNPGVGTMPAPGFISKIGKAVTRGLGAGFGLGITGDVIDACRYIMRHWQPGDKIYIFGFSRGAYAARIIAGLIDQCGILRPDLENLLPYAVRIYRNSYKPSGANVARQFKQTFSNDAKIHFLGLWDTVSSVGRVWAPVGWPGTAKNLSIEHARHAIAIEEHRTFFRTNRIYPHDDLPNQDIKQWWFPGVHSDVGGGYPESESSLWLAPLLWIAGEAMSKDLKLNEDLFKTYEDRQQATLGTPLFPQEPHESLKSFWKIFEYFPKLRYNSEIGKRQLYVNLGKVRGLRRGELLAPAVKQVYSRSDKWNPPTLVNAGVTSATIDSLGKNADGAAVVP
jgi:uncharacterized protein (DUF2235 family)